MFQWIKRSFNKWLGQWGAKEKARHYGIGGWVRCADSVYRFGTASDEEIVQLGRQWVRMDADGEILGRYPTLRAAINGEEPAAPLLEQ